MKQHRQSATVVAIGTVVFCLSIGLASGAPAQQQTDSIEKHDLGEIQTIVTDLLDSGINISLEEHQLRFIKGDTQNLLVENFLFATADGFLFTISTEKVIDKNYKPKVVSYFDVSEDDAQKVLLSLLGGGNIKALTVKKAR
ncbi:uncharacterized protein LOC126559424 [Anopheles maculipalpis]|uniref:uncharacterized protein LOC126559424 n=1 Tax=Anopheles maculipalpis TaxID=1496333 RepID=UPI0021597B21|nr:uncharacterized protein LOC126559424 [Anopheles maculipalpis]